MGGILLTESPLLMRVWGDLHSLGGLTGFGIVANGEGDVLLGIGFVSAEPGGVSLERKRASFRFV